MASANEFLSLRPFCHSDTGIPRQASEVFPPYPYLRTDKYNCWTDGNMFYGNQETARK